MELGELITALEAEDPAKALPHGFNSPHSYRGYYEQLVFEPAGNVTVGAMLAAARSALDGTYQGYKGGLYTMGEDTDCWLAPYGRLGEEIGPVLLRLMLAAGTVPAAPATELTEEQRLAERAIRNAIKDIGWDDLGDQLMNEYAELTDAKFDALRTRICDLTAEATVTVTWPEAGDQAEAGR